MHQDSKQRGCQRVAGLHVCTRASLKWWWLLAGSSGVAILALLYGAWPSDKGPRSQRQVPVKSIVATLNGRGQEQVELGRKSHRGGFVHIAPLRHGLIEQIEAAPVDGGGANPDALEKRWEHEAADPDWSANMTAYINGVIDAADAGDLIDTEVACRTSVCKVKLRASDQGALVRLNGFVLRDQMEFRLTPSSDAGLSEVVALVTDERLRGRRAYGEGDQPK